MKTITSLLLLLLLKLGAAEFQLPLRTRDAAGTPIEKRAAWDAAKTALIICDMWDTHTCPNAAARVGEMAPRVDAVAKAVRAAGGLVIHCPSDTLKFYEGTPGRKLAQAAPRVEPKVPLQRWCRLDPAKEAPLPIDDTDGGCDCETTWKRGDPYPWTRQHAAIGIGEGDAITESDEAYFLIRQRGIERVLICGVHLNMCVLGRPFGIRQLVAQGLDVVLLRDLTDTMYNPARRPWVNHFAGTELMVAHVEKHWCATTTSDAVAGGAPFRFAADKPPRVLFLVGDSEYRTGETVPAWARAELEPRGVRCEFLVDDPKKPFHFPQLEKPEADALFISIKRRGLPPAQLAGIRKFVESGRPVIGIRTASHAFDPKKPEPGDATWPAFDREVFGGWYQNHYGKGPATLAKPAGRHPVLAGLPADGMKFTSHLYKCRDLAPGTTVLLNGTLEGKDDVTEPLAWLNEKPRAFYASPGAPEDFEQPAFRRLLLNATLHLLGQPLPQE